MPTQLEHDIQNRPAYFKRIKHMLEAHELKVKSIHFRRKLLEDRKKAGYQNEYDRLRGAIAHTVVTNHTKAIIEKRKAELIKLGAQALPEVR